MSNDLRFRAWLEDQVSKPLERINDGFDKLAGPNAKASFWGNVGAGAVKKGFDLVGDAAQAATDFVMDSIDAASDLAETQSKSNVVFGDSAKAMDEWGDTTASAMGISKQAALEAGATFGNFFVGLGQGEAQAADMSKRLVGLSSDLASFNNMDPTEVLDKLRAGLAGEAEPLRRVGVFLNEAKVKAKAMELGLGDAHGELTDGEKVLARYQIILDETSTAQGDFARTSEGLANQQRIANAELENSQAALGEKLLPAQLSATRAQLDLFTALGAYGDILEGRVTPESLALARAFGHISDEGLRAGLAAIEARSKLDFMAGALKDDSRAADDATGSLDKTADAAKTVGDEHAKAVEKVRDLKEELLDEARTLIDDYYEPIEARQAIQRNNAEITAAKRILESGRASTAEKRDARSTITQAQKDNDRLALELLATGTMTEKEKKALIKRVEDGVRTTTGRTRQYFRDLRAEINRIDGMTAYINFVTRIRSQGVGSAVHAGGFQHGGFIGPGQTGTVGEVAQETVHMLPGGGGIVIPTGSPDGRGGGGGTIHVHFHAVATPSPSEGQRLARAVIPELVREMRRQGLMN